MVKDVVMSSNNSEVFTTGSSGGGKRRCSGPSAGVTPTREWREYVAGWGSGIINIALTFPVNKTMFRQQLHGISAWESASQLRAEGLVSLYR